MTKGRVAASSTTKSLHTATTRTITHKSGRAAPSTPKSMISAASVMGDRTMGGSRHDAPYKIDFSAIVLPVGQRYDCIISLKQGVKRKKVMPVYKVESAPVYDRHRQDKEENEDEDGGGGEDDNEKSDKAAGDEAHLSSATIRLMLGLAVIGILVGIGCLAASTAVTLM